MAKQINISITGIVNLSYKFIESTFEAANSRNRGIKMREWKIEEQTTGVKNAVDNRGGKSWSKSYGTSTRDHTEKA